MIEGVQTRLSANEVVYKRVDYGGGLSGCDVLREYVEMLNYMAAMN